MLENGDLCSVLAEFLVEDDCFLLWEGHYLDGYPQEELLDVIGRG